MYQGCPANEAIKFCHLSYESVLTGGKNKRGGMENWEGGQGEGKLGEMGD